MTVLLSRKTFVLAIIVFIIMTSTFSIAYAKFDSVINATVKLNVCGDNIVEGPENCEGNNLDNQTCSSFGYSGGSLECDIACTFDVTSCIAPSQTPIPTPTSTPTIAPTSSPDVSISSNSNSELVTNPTTQAVVISGPTQAIDTVSVIPLPDSVLAFDISGSGRILIQDLPDMVRLWIEEWRAVLVAQIDGVSDAIQYRICDVNLDNSCNLKDFSVLMFYVES